MGRGYLILCVYGEGILNCATFSHRAQHEVSDLEKQCQEKDQRIQELVPLSREIQLVEKVFPNVSCIGVACREWVWLAGSGDDVLHTFTGYGPCI